MPQGAISSIDDLMSELTSSDAKKLIFRGENKDFGNTSLMPSFGRHIHDAIPKNLKKLTGDGYPTVPKHVAGLLNLERAYLHRFYNSLSVHRQQHMGFDLLDAQHRGLPTRLLDWSENPLVALFFASEPNDNDGHFFSLAVEPESVWSGSDPLDSSGGQNASSILDMNIEIMFPVRIGQRISRQLGCFTIHKAPWIKADHDFQSCVTTNSSGKKTVNLTSQAPRILKHKIRIFAVPASAKEALRRDLSVLGINKETLWLYSEETVEADAIDVMSELITCQLAKRA